MRLEVPLGDEILPVSITPKMAAVRFSLRSADPSVVKERQAAAVAYLEGVYRNLRANAPVSLTHKQCVALSGELYRTWARDLDASQRISFVQEADGTITREYGDDMVELQAGYEAMVAKLEGMEEPSDLEPVLGLSWTVSYCGAGSPLLTRPHGKRC